MLRYSAGNWSIDVNRHQIDLIPPAEYLNMSYYEKWLRSTEELLVIHGMVTPTELATGKPDAGAPRATPAIDAAAMAKRLGRGIASGKDPKFAPLFKVGQTVRARNMNPEGHTQLPRYVRGKTGTVAIDHGVYNFPDTNAHMLGTKRQHVYSVRFTARELWGEKASPRDTVHVDMWDDYLEHA
jgi:nitrile hydratase